MDYKSDELCGLFGIRTLVIMHFIWCIWAYAGQLYNWVRIQFDRGRGNVREYAGQLYNWLRAQFDRGRGNVGGVGGREGRLEDGAAEQQV